MALTELR